MLLHFFSFSMALYFKYVCLYNATTKLHDQYKYGCSTCSVTSVVLKCISLLRFSWGKKKQVSTLPKHACVQHRNSPIFFIEQVKRAAQ